jgi:hypothetical protein
MGARQRPYYAADHAGYVFVFPRDATGYPPPFFAGTDPGDLVAAPPFEFLIDCPWWLIGTNGFDLQHFTGLHDRKIVSAPMIESPHPAARRIIATFEICGKSWRDQLTRRFAGLHVTMDVTIWSGTLAFVMAHFHDSPNWDRLDAGATSYGMTEILPIFSPQRTRSRVRVTVFRRRRSGLGLLDRLDARIKRYFIQAFLKPDTLLLAGSRYDPNHMVESDRQMVEYLRWLASASRCRSIPEEHK